MNQDKTENSTSYYDDGWGKIIVSSHWGRLQLMKWLIVSWREFIIDIYCEWMIQSRDGDDDDKIFILIRQIGKDDQNDTKGEWKWREKNENGKFSFEILCMSAEKALRNIWDRKVTRRTAAEHKVTTMIRESWSSERLWHQKRAVEEALQEVKEHFQPYVNNGLFVCLQCHHFCKVSRESRHVGLTFFFQHNFDVCLTFSKIHSSWRFFFCFLMGKEMLK